MSFNPFLKFVSVATLLFSNSLLAQSPIVLNTTNENMLQPGTYHARGVNTATLNAPTKGANKTWDFSKIQGGQVNATNLIQVSSFSSTAVGDTTASVLIADGLSIPLTNVYDMDASGFFNAGAVIAKQAYDISNATGNKGDTLFVPAQVLKYRQTYVQFPCSYDSSWKSAYKTTINFIVDSKKNFLNNAPASKVSHVTVIDSVVGWGALNIPSSNKSGIPYPVLLVKERATTMDSFYLYGSPAPKILLDNFLVSQGMTTSTYTEYFFRTGTVVPLLTIGYDSDYTYSSASTASFSTDNVQSGIEEGNTSLINLSIYPNPAINGLAECSFIKPSAGNWKLNIINTLGQIVQSKTIEGTGKISSEINLENVNKSGLYLVNIYDENSTLIANSKLDIGR